MGFWKENYRAVLAVGLLFVSSMVVCASLAGAEARTAGAWGLHFQEEGEPPVGNTNQTILSGYDGAYMGDPKEQTIYLTFDSGYENGCTAKILDVLKAHEAPAAFFLVGNYLETEPELVKRMVEEGHTVGNHTWSHPDMTQVTAIEFAEELRKMEEKYQTITGQDLPKFYRPPQGNYSEETLKQAKALGYKTVFWSLAYADWNNDKQPTPEEAFSKLIPRIHNGAVVLLHSTSQTNAAILDELLTRWEAMGYRFGTLEELFG